MAPYAYQVKNGKHYKVPCFYVLEKDILSFTFPEGYDKNLQLIIDPTVIGATMTGTTDSYNYGHSATFDNSGNIYMAGISFGIGYATTNGAFQENFASGNTDIVISKYNSDGSDLIYATYIGGNDVEYPHSTVTDIEGQLYIMGSSKSDDFPVSSDAIQPDHGGSIDIIITKLSKDGDALMGSTFIGGIDNDGQNISDYEPSLGDKYRGEIILDANSNVYIASCTKSVDFPVSPNAYQKNLYSTGPTKQDGVLMKLNSDLES